MLKNKELLLLTLIILVGFILRIAAIFGIKHTPESDELAYISMSLNLLNGNGIVDHMGNHAMYNVGYPLFILAPLFFFTGEDHLSGRLINIILGGITIVMCYLLAKEAGAGKLGRLMAALVWALYLPASVYGVYLLKEHLMTPLILGVVWCALRLVKQPSKRVAVGCGVLFGLLALTGNAALSLVGMVVLALFLTPELFAKRATLSLIMFTVGLLVASPWMLRNVNVIGAPVMNTNGGFNLYLGNNPAATGMFVSIADTPRGSTWEELRKTGEVQASETLKQEAIAWIKSNPTEFTVLAFKKLMYFWMPPFHEGKGEQSSIEKLIRLLWAVQFLIMVSLAISVLFISSLRNPNTSILLLAIACYTSVHMLFYVIFRYREPIMPLVGVLAALVFETILSRTAAIKNKSNTCPDFPDTNRPL